MWLRKSKQLPREALSPTRLSWIRLRRDPGAMAGLGWILTAILLSVGGYLVIPDKTPFANHQQLELAAHPPATSMEFLLVTKNQDFKKTGPLKGMITGFPSPYNTIPIQRWWVAQDTIHYEAYSGQKGFPGKEGFFLLPDVIMAVKTESIAIDQENKVVFQDIHGQWHQMNIEAIQEKTLTKHIRKKRFPLGTDRFGRDMLSQLVIGTRVSLSVGFIAVFISLAIGITLGSVAGYFRGRVDQFIVWLINVVWSIPTLLLAIAITFALGKGFWQVFVAVGLTMWVEVARIVRGQVISIREKEFVESARALGYTGFRIIRRHILPAVMGPVIVVSAANFASAILIEAGLSFLGIGVQPPMPSWGSMIREHYGYIILDKATLALFPGFAIMLMVLSFMLLGNGLREATQPSSKQ